MKKGKYLMIGIVFIFAIAIFIWGYNFLKGNDVFSKQKVFYARYENVGGLLTANPVLINGMQVGQVRSLYFDPDMSGNIIVEFLMSSSFPIPIDTKAVITNANLLGDKLVTFELGKSRQLAQDGDTLRGKVEATLSEAVNEELAPIKEKAENLLSSLDTLIIEMNNVFGGQAGLNLRSSFNDIKFTFHNLENTTANINTLVEVQANSIAHIISNLEAFSTTLKSKDEILSSTLDNLNSISDSLSQLNYRTTLIGINQSVEQLKALLVKINSGKGSIGKLISNDSLYFEVNKSAVELNKLLKDIRENPKRYVKFSLF